METMIGRQRIECSIQDQNGDTVDDSQGKDDPTQTCVSETCKSSKLLEERCGLGEAESNLLRANQNRKRPSHILIKMSARINGEEFSPNSVSSRVIHLDQENLRSSLYLKRSVDNTLNNTAVFQNPLEKEADVGTLRAENKRLLALNEELKGLSSLRRHIRSSDKLHCASGIFTDQIRSQRVQETANPHLQRMRAEQQLSKVQKLRLGLQKKVLDLEMEIKQKDQSIQQITKQSQHQVNLLYQKLSKRLKAKEVEAYMNGKELKQQRLKTKQLQTELEKMEQEKSFLASRQIQRGEEVLTLLGVIKRHEQAIGKGNILGLRLGYCQTQVKYSTQELARQKLQGLAATQQLVALKGEVARLKKQLQDHLSRSYYNGHQQISNLKESLYCKQAQISKLKGQVLMMCRLQKDLQSLSRKYKQAKQLLSESNEQLMKVRLCRLSDAWKKGY